MKLIISCLCILAICTNITAQETTLSGQVLDELNTPIEYAAVYEGNNHTHTDVFGKFELDGISIGDTLNIKYLGFSEVTRIIKSKDFKNGMNIVLKSKNFELDQISISKSLRSTNIISTVDIAISPVNSSQEVLRKVPGLIIGQHAGGGKAEQIFLRGFDIDHGTDIALSVDGIPVNLVSHAHGQGYSDLHFLIPETIDKIDFGKGPYYSEIGNFNTAGYVKFKTKDKLDESSISLELGKFNTMSMTGLFDLLGSSEKQYAYIATKYQESDGPLESPQNFNRLNLMGKYGIEMESGDLLSVSFSKMQSKWDASGQIPQRLVDDGSITRFGAVDSTEGGNTGRTDMSLNHTKSISDDLFVKTNAYYSNYNFELFSNFTFFLEDSINGDQIRQQESRSIYGLNTTLFHTPQLKNTDLELSYNFGMRYDDINEVSLANTINRKTVLNNLSLGDVDETNINIGTDINFDFGKWLINGGFRVDYFSFNYVNKLSTNYDNKSVDKYLLSPKLSFIFNPSSKWQYYLKMGKGFHSNDSRVVTSNTSEVLLPSAYGADLGFIIKPHDKLWINTALWYLFLEQEFVYVGDAGIVEPSGETRRQGIDFSARYQLGQNIFINTDVSFADALSVNEPEESNYIPLAVSLMAAGGISLKDWNNFNAGIRYRYIKDRPANEDFTITALGYFITDLNISYNFNNITTSFIIENLFDVDWNEAQFATESKLNTEQAPVEELHFTPGVPFFWKASLKYSF